MPIEMLPVPDNINFTVNRVMQFHSSIDWVGDYPRPMGTSVSLPTNTAVEVIWCMESGGTRYHLVRHKADSTPHDSFALINLAYLNTVTVPTVATADEATGEDDAPECLISFPDPAHGRSYDVRLTDRGYRGLLEQRTGICVEDHSSRRHNVMINGTMRMYLNEQGRELGTSWTLSITELLPSPTEQWATWKPVILHARSFYLTMPTRANLTRRTEIDPSVKHLLKGLGMEGLWIWMKLFRT